MCNICPKDVLARRPVAPSTPTLAAKALNNPAELVNNLLDILAKGAIIAILAVITLISPAVICPIICCLAISCGSSCLTIKSGYIVVVKPVAAFIE